MRDGDDYVTSRGWTYQQTNHPTLCNQVTHSGVAFGYSKNYAEFGTGSYLAVVNFR
jgi:hypothetical protein